MVPLSLYRQHVERWKDCKKCSLCHVRQHVVISKGVVPCDVLFVGEAPGQSEDVGGFPFEGPAGKRLDQIIERAFRPYQVPGTEGPIYNSHPWAMTNLVCCLPTDESGSKASQPEQAEIMACSDRLREFIAIAQPRILVCVGDLSKDWIPKIIEQMEPTDFTAAIHLRHIAHPAHILRMPLLQQNQASNHCVNTIRQALEALR